MMATLTNIELCNSLKGLMFSKKRNVYFVNSKSQKVIIHMFFVSFPLNILFLNESFEVIEKIVLQPWRVYFTKKPVKYIIELADNQDAQLGDTIETFIY